MPRVAPGDRKRAKKPKTRTGCKTFRRVKCDEQKPSCLKCTSTGRVCDGYNNELCIKLSSPATFTRETTQTISPIRSPSLEVPGDSRERRALHFFCERTVRQLNPFRADDFWDLHILQATQHEPSIRHAIVALGSLHEKFEQSDGLILPQSDDFALQQYNLGITSLLEPFSRGGQQNMDVCLTASILFACFEPGFQTLQGRLGLAIAHIRSGARLLYEIEYNENQKKHNHKTLKCSSSPFVPMEILEDLFLRVYLQIVEMVGPITDLPIHKKTSLGRQGGTPPTAFSSLGEARNCLIYNWHERTTPREFKTGKTTEDLHRVVARQNESLALYDQYNSAFQSFLATKGSVLNDSQRKGVRVLEIHHLAAYVALNSKKTTLDVQTVWDQYVPIFDKIVTLAEEVTLLDSLDTAAPVFSIDMGIVAPLYSVAHKCRDPIVRRRAIAVLKAAPRQEGVWNSTLVARVCERVVDLEEAGLGMVTSCADVPDWARLSAVIPIFAAEGRKAVLTYSRGMSPNEFVRNTYEEEIVW
ncbi:hypothetical protein GLAREA_09778 [Glarea lozoyensis ATCC 20868]|uniref:Zn2/Cys6 DNA-binding protein n=1 Tax=Glarea lozoyensis (strain ATCC 20868 / MF5171) TaxID=1116229 RepID=S3CQA6_GLAL2|nr:uncharacterized protein GLAREA_09778 [Glarea lozoyensis ATCC 20868]EPE28657.1 hypothetical protein GLAREA_09778 [Glarea lozoyensis ATCC 20868]